jgi:uncharacterized protein YjdB
MTLRSRASRVLAVVAVFASASCDNSRTPLAPVVGQAGVATLRIEPRNATIVVGSPVEHQALIVSGSEAAPAGSATWRTLDPDFAGVSSRGVVTARLSGTARITATTSVGVDTVTVSTVPGPPRSFTRVSGSHQTATTGSMLADRLVVRVVDGAGNRLPGVTVSWAAPAGAVTPVAAVTDHEGHASATWRMPAVPGNYLARATMPGFTDVTFTAYAVEPAIAYITVSPASTTLLPSIGSNIALSARAFDASGSSVSVAFEWASSDTSVAVVNSNGGVTSRGNGSALITATVGTTVGVIGVTVSQLPASVTVLPSPAATALGDTLQMVALVRDARGVPIDGATVRWTSSNTSIGRIDADGRLASQALGSTVVEAASGDKAGTRTVKVEPQPVASISLAASNSDLMVGQGIQVIATLYDKNGSILTGRSVTWSTSNAAIITVTNAGLVTAAAAGDARITAASGAASAGMDIRVRAGAPAHVVAISGGGQSVVVGTEAASELVARVLDSAGNPVSGASVAWGATGGGGVQALGATTDAAGYVRARAVVGTTAGPHTYTAGIQGVGSASFSIAAVPGPLATVLVTPNPAVLEPSVSQLQLGVAGADVFGNAAPVTGATWSSSNLSVASVSSNGLLVRQGTGSATVTVQAGGVAAQTAVTVVASTAPFIAAISADTLVPGMTVTLTGGNFSASTSGNTVSIGGKTATVLAASASSLSVRLQARGNYTCQATGPVEVRVVVGTQSASREHTLRIPVRHNLGVGESAIVAAAAADARCIELGAGGNAARYFVSVYDAGRSGSVQTSVRFSGSTIGAAASALPQLVAAAAAARQPQVGQEDMEEARRHGDLLEVNRQLIEQLGPEQATAFTGGPSLVAAQVGATRTFKVTNGFATGNYCGTWTTITARAAYVGPRVVFWEDEATVVAAQMDTAYARLAAELEGPQWSLVTATFGNPLAMDASLGNDGRINVLVSPQVNSRRVSGFVFSGDMRQTSSCAASNVLDMVYMYAPTTANSRWNTDFAAIMIHEIKHLISYVERISRGISLEEAWLEEATAQVATELYARQVYNYAQRSNVTYAGANMHCDRYPTAAGCPGVAGAIMIWNWLNPYYWGFEGRSWLLSGTNDWYGSGWMFVRWAADHAAQTEASFFRSVTTGSQTGLTKIESLTGRSWNEMLGEFTLSLLTDDRPGLTTANPRLQQLGWHTRDVTQRLWGSSVDYMIDPRQLPAGDFAADATLRGGAGALFSLAGSSQDRLLRLTSPSGGLSPTTIRIGIVRVE